MTRAFGLAAGTVLLGAWLQASALAPFGLTEAGARELILTDVESGGTSDHRNMSYTPLVLKGRESYPKIPAANRAAVTTALFGWAKGYISSPAFKTQYLKIRAEAKPIPTEYALTIDQEIQKELDEQLAGHKQMEEAAKSMPAAERASILASIKEAQAQMKNPAMLAAIRADKVEARAKDAAALVEGTKFWAARFPADPNAFSIIVLRNFLAGTAEVDYTAKVIEIQGEGGSGPGFADEALRQKPWMWVECVLAGKDAVTAARAAAQAWLKELGG